SISQADVEAAVTSNVASGDGATRRPGSPNSVALQVMRTSSTIAHPSLQSALWSTTVPAHSITGSSGRSCGTSPDPGSVSSGSVVDEPVVPGSPSVASVSEPPPSD